MALKFINTLLVIALFSFQLLAQNKKEVYGSCIKANGYALEITFHNDTLARFSYDSYNGGYSFPVKYYQSKDSMIFSNPLPIETQETVVSYDTAINNIIDISVSAYFDNGFSISLFNIVSKDGVHFDTLEVDESLVLGKIEEIPDSILVNRKWVKLEKEKITSTIFVDQYTYSPPNNFDFKGFPCFFDSLIFIKKMDYWQVVESSKLNQFDLSLFKEVRLVTWYWMKDDIVVRKNKNHNFIPNQIIHRMVIDSVYSNQLDLTKYTSLKHLIVNNSPGNLKIKSSILESLTVNCDSSVSQLKLKIDQNRIESLKTNVPIESSNIKNVHNLSYNINSEKEQNILNSNLINTTNLYLYYTCDDMRINISENWKNISYLFISKDSINLTCDFSVLSRLDTLVLYGHSNQFSFLDCKHNLKYIGVFYSNESELGSIKSQYPELNQEVWCFPSYTNVNLDNENSTPITKIGIGDTLISLDNSGNIIPSIITCIEYHFNVEATIWNFKSNDIIASATKAPFFTYSTFFTKQHPLNINGIPRQIEGIKYAEEIQTINGSMVLSNFELSEKEYSGTLINVKTKEGNYFINKVNFMNK